MNKLKFIFLLTVFILSAGFLKAQEDSKTPRRLKNGKRPAKVSKYQLAQFDGRWQEISRIKAASNVAVTIDDTLFIHFYDSIKATTKEGNSVVITGTVELSGEADISTSANDYKVVSVNENELVLDDYNGYIRKLEKKKVFYYEIEKTPPTAAPDTAKGIVDLSPASLSKNWFAYRRGANPGYITTETPLIRNLIISDKITDSTYKAEIEFSRRGQAITEPCVITFNSNNNVSIIAAGNTWNVEIYKADGHELILGKKGELVYYFKPQ